MTTSDDDDEDDGGGDFHFLDSYLTSYGSGAVELVVYVEQANEVRNAIARQRAWVRERLTKLIVVSDALPAGALDGLDAIVDARIAAGLAKVVRRSGNEHEAALDAEDGERARTRRRREALEDDRPSPILQRSGTTCRLSVSVKKPGDLSRALEVPFVRDALPYLNELHLIGGDADVLDELGPELKMRALTGVIALVLRSHAEQDDIDADEEAARLGGASDEVILRAHTRGRALPWEPRRAHPRASSLVAPAISATSLKRSDANPNDDTPPTTGGTPVPPRGAPRGLMAGHVGDAIDRGSLRDGDDALEAKLASRVRGWHVPALQGKVLVIHDVTRVASAVRGLLFECFGDIPFRVEGGGYGGFPKHLHFHTSVIAPPDHDRPMALELYGPVLTIGDPRRPAREMGRALIEARRGAARGFDLATRAGRRSAALAAAGADLPMPICVRIDVAVYANVMFPGVGVPFYM